MLASLAHARLVAKRCCEKMLRKDCNLTFAGLQYPNVKTGRTIVMSRLIFSRRAPRAMRSITGLLLAGVACAGAQTVQPMHAPVAMQSPVLDKNFYLLTLLERTPVVHAQIKGDSTLNKIAEERLAAMDQAAKACGTDLDCNTQAFRWSDGQAREAGHALGALYRKSPLVRGLADGPLRASGMYVLYQELSGEDLLKHAWDDCVHGMNQAIEVYGIGKAPRYPAIDAMTYDPKTDSYRQVVQGLVLVLEDDRPALDLFFMPSLRFSSELILLNHRDEAGRYEPMELGENAAAFKRVKTVPWAKYPYSVIVVPGAGNDQPGVSLSPTGRLRDELAAKRFRDGKAPFLIVSGGFVHPIRTEFSEAIEMKHDLMTRFGIPADSIIVDPHARHTTTNMRNAARLIYRYGIPFDKTALVTTDPSQSRNIESSAFDQRCMDELGYVPHKILSRISPFDLTFLPIRGSLQANPLEPLDP
jgi:hypothetical protein